MTFGDFIILLSLPFDTVCKTLAPSAAPSNIDLITGSLNIFSRFMSKNSGINNAEYDADSLWTESKLQQDRNPRR